MTPSNVDHYVNGKYVPLGWVQDDPIPRGQAYISPLVTRCYRIIQQTYEREHPGAASPPIQQNLEDIIDQLKFIVSALLFYSLAPIVSLQRYRRTRLEEKG
jgi:hypothetical protein